MHRPFFDFEGRCYAWPLRVAFMKPSIYSENVSLPEKFFNFYHLLLALNKTFLALTVWQWGSPHKVVCHSDSEVSES